MNLFRRHRNPAEPAEISFQLAPAVETHKPIQLRQISMSAEQKSLLDSPIDPRVERIMQEIYADKAAAERALNSRRIIFFPSADSGERHVVQDQDGFWRIVPGPAPQADTRLFDAI